MPVPTGKWAVSWESRTCISSMFTLQMLAVQKTGGHVHEAPCQCPQWHSTMRTWLTMALRLRPPSRYLAIASFFRVLSGCTSGLGVRQTWQASAVPHPSTSNVPKSVMNQLERTETERFSA